MEEESDKWSEGMRNVIMSIVNQGLTQRKIVSELNKLKLFRQILVCFESRMMCEGSGHAQINDTRRHTDYTLRRLDSSKKGLPMGRWL